MPNTRKQALIIGLDDKQKRLLKVLLKHQKNICRIREDSRREKFPR